MTTKTEAEARKLAEAIQELPATLRGLAWTVPAIALRQVAVVHVYGALVAHGAAPPLPWQAVAAVWLLLPVPHTARVPTEEVPPRAQLSMVVSLIAIALCWA